MPAFTTNGHVAYVILGRWRTNTFSDYLPHLSGSEIQLLLLLITNFCKLPMASKTHFILNNYNILIAKLLYRMYTKRQLLLTVKDLARLPLRCHCT